MGGLTAIYRYQTATTSYFRHVDHITEQTIYCHETYNGLSQDHEHASSTKYSRSNTIHDWSTCYQSYLPRSKIQSRHTHHLLRRFSSNRVTWPSGIHWSVNCDLPVKVCVHLFMVPTRTYLRHVAWTTLDVLLDTTLKVPCPILILLITCFFLQSLCGVRAFQRYEIYFSQHLKKPVVTCCIQKLSKAFKLVITKLFLYS